MKIKRSCINMEKFLSIMIDSKYLLIISMYLDRVCTYLHMDWYLIFFRSKSRLI